MSVPTYQDCVNHLLDYLGSDPSDAALRDAKKAVNEAYRDLANAHTWTYLYTPVCLQTAQMIGEDPNNSGISDGTTITYKHSGGEFPRMVTLYGVFNFPPLPSPFPPEYPFGPPWSWAGSGAQWPWDPANGTPPWFVRENWPSDWGPWPFSTGSTPVWPPQPRPAAWPSWAQDGILVLGHNDPTEYGISYGANLAYFVDRVISPTVLTLREDSNPGADIPYPTAYAFYRDAYPLPRDFISQDVTFIPNNFPSLQPIHPREWMRISQNEVRVGKPIYYSILGYDREPGRHAVHFSPIPDIVYEIHYAYKRMPRSMRLYAQSTGVVSMDADLRTVVGLQGATFTKAMEGNSIIRFGSNGSIELPTDEFRDNPYAFEGLITQYLDSTHVLIEPAAPTVVQNVPYTISDMADIDPGSMTTVLLRLCEQKLSVIRILKDRQFPISEYLVALDRAKCADSRSMMGRSPREYLFNRQVDISLWRNR